MRWLVCLAVAAALWLGVDAPALAQDAQPEALSALESGERALSEARLSDAVSAFELALEAARERGALADEARARAGLAAVALTRRQFEAAAEHFAAAAEGFEQAGERGWLAVMHYQRGALERARGDQAAAAEAFGAAERTFDQVSSIDGDRDLAARWRAASLVALGEVLQADSPDAAVKAFGDAAGLYKKIDAELDEADARYRKGLAEHARGRYDRAERDLDAAIKLYRLGDDTLWIAVSQAAIGQVMLDAGDADRASTRLKTAVDLLARREDARMYELSARLGLARSLARLGSVPEALEEYGQAAKLAELLDEPAWRAAVDVGHGQALVEGARFDEAIARFEAVVDYAGGESLARQRAASLLALGEIHLARGEHDRALARYDEVLGLQPLLGDEALAASARLGRGEVLLSRGELDVAEAALEEAISGLSLGALAERGRGTAALAEIVAQRGNGSRAHSLYKESIGLFERGGEMLHLGRAHQAEARLYLAESNARSAQRSLESAVEALRKAGARREQTEARLLLADALVLRGDPDVAMEVYERVGDSLAELGLGMRAGHAYLKAGQLYRDDRKREEALNAARHALEHLDVEGADPSAEAAAAAQLTGELMNELGRVDEAVVALRRSVELSVALGQDEVRLGASYMLGELLRDAERYDEAIVHYEQAIAVASTLGRETQRAEALMGLGQIFLKKGDARAVKTLETAKDIFHDVRSPREGVARRWRSRAYKAFGEPK